jgi:hypothetical protein
MKVLFSGDTFCDLATFKRLVLIADEIGFMDRPSITFKEWGTIGRDSEIRSYQTSGLPILLSAHSPPSGPVTELYSRYIEADLKNRDFIKMGLRVRVWVILYLFEHTRKDFQTEILLVS